MQKLYVYHYYDNNDKVVISAYNFIPDKDLANKINQDERLFISAVTKALYKAGVQSIIKITDYHYREDEQNCEIKIQLLENNIEAFKSDSNVISKWITRNQY